MAESRLPILGIAVGLVFGALPGLNGNVAIGLLIPFTFHLNPIVAIRAIPTACSKRPRPLCQVARPGTVARTRMEGL